MTSPIVLDARLDSAAAESLADILRPLQDSDVVIDATAVTLLGAKALQTLLVAAQAWRASGRAFAISNLSPDVATQIADLGIADPALVTGGAS
jgi:anti-anti-sigma regulatory factor